MKIAYDGSGLTPPVTGVGNYIGQLLTHLLQIDEENTYWVLAHRRPYVAPWLNGNGHSLNTSAHFPNRFFWMQCVLPLALRRVQPDVAHFPNFVAPLAGADNLVVTVHDVLLLRYPELYSPRQRVLMRPLIQPTARRARAIITVSEQSKREMVRTLGVAPERVRVIYEAAAPTFHEPQDRTEQVRRCSQYGWDRDARHLLYVGTIEPRKNLETLVEALAVLHRRGKPAHLWIVGHAGWHAAAVLKRVQQVGLETFVHITGYVPLDDLRAFYQGCDVFVFPSLYEGFGLPVLEAMASNAPVVVSNIPALHEVTADASISFDPTNAQELADAIGAVLDDHELSRELRVHSRARAREFSWERAARETLALYNEVAHSRQPLAEKPPSKSNGANRAHPSRL